MRYPRQEQEVTLPPLAREFGVSRTKLWYLAREGAIPAIWKRRQYVVRRSDVPRIAARLRREGLIPQAPQVEVQVA